MQSDHREKATEAQKMMNQNIKVYWSKFVPIYQLFDWTTQTFYYTLINILDIRRATNILEVACGTGKLIPLAVSMKSKQCKYLATDLSEAMVQRTKQTIDDYIKKLGVQTSVQAWIKQHRLQLKALNGEDQIQTSEPFDRIICNLVLMITANPVRMLKNLHRVAAQGCLMGVTIWGDKKLSNFLTIADRANQQWGKPVSTERSNFDLYKKLPELCEQSGWQMVVEWQQQAPFNFIDLNQNLMKLVQQKSMNNQKLLNYHIQKITQIFGQKKVLNFPVQMAVLRKK